MARRRIMPRFPRETPHYRDHCKSPPCSVEFGASGNQGDSEGQVVRARRGLQARRKSQIEGSCCVFPRKCCIISVKSKVPSCSEEDGTVATKAARVFEDPVCSWCVCGLPTSNLVAFSLEDCSPTYRQIEDTRWAGWNPESLPWRLKDCASATWLIVVSTNCFQPTAEKRLYCYTLAVGHWTAERTCLSNMSCLRADIHWGTRNRQDVHELVSPAICLSKTVPARLWKVSPGIVFLRRPLPLWERVRKGTTRD